MKKYYNICKQDVVTEQDMINVVRYYIKLRKNQEIQINPPSRSAFKPDALLRCQLLHQAYDIAKDFILVAHDAPERITVTIYA